jgi:hypothetical protein
MQELISFFSSGLVGTLIGCVGIAISLLIYIKSKRIVAFGCEIYSTELIGDRRKNFPKDVVIMYKGQKLDAVSRSRVFLWNNGNRTIHGKDIVESNRTRFFVEKGEIFLFETRKISRNENLFKFELSSDAKTVFVSFDYIEPNQGVCVDFFHTNGADGVKIAGLMRGMNTDIAKLNSKIRESYSFLTFFDRVTDIMRISIKRSKVTTFAFLASIGVSVTTLGLFGYPTERNGLNVSVRITFERLIENFYAGNYSVANPVFFLGIIYMILPIAMWFASRRRFPKNLEP